MTLTYSDFEIADLTQLDSADVQQTLDRLVSQLQELNPALDLRRGVFKDTLAYYHAVLDAAIRANLERYQSARSLQKIQEDPTLADDTVVSEVLSNWGIVRKPGTKAVGPVTIELSELRPLTIPQNSIFEANGFQYLTTATFVGRIASAQILSENDRLLTPLSNGNYAFTIEVEAADIGADRKLNAGDLIVPNRSIVNYATSYATSSFEDGTNTETNEELLNELQLGISAKALSNRTNMRAYLRSLPQFASITNQSIVGCGDPEMLRDKHTIFPTLTGGRVDWYIRGQSAIQRKTAVASATCISVSTVTGTSQWQFTVPASVLPGFYEIDKIRRSDAAFVVSGFNIVSDTRSIDLTGAGFLPDIATVEEGAYTAFQNAIVRFEDTVTPVADLAVGQAADYIYEITGVPYIKELQDLVSSRDIRHYGADALIKAPVPCFVSVTLTINKAADDVAPLLDPIRAAIIDEINAIDFQGVLPGSAIVDTVHNFLQGRLNVTELDILGRIRMPDGTIKYVRSDDALLIPELPEKMVTSKTVQFFAETSNVNLNIVSSIPVAT
jgi:hypothetical protein